MKMNGKSRFILFLVLSAVLAFSAFGCTGDDDDDDDSAGVVEDDDDAGPEDDNYLDEPAVALVITSETMAAPWQDFADWKNSTGLRTDVVFVEEILSENDDAFALKDYLREAYDSGITYVTLGGDADQIPYARGYSEVWALTDYYGHAPIQTFYEDLDHDWDADGDGKIGELGEDIALEDMRTPEISVGRVPVETKDEAQGYVDKLIRYEMAAGNIKARATASIFLGDVAAEVPLVGEIDGGMMHEQLIADYMPASFLDNMARFYGTELFADFVGAQVGSTEAIVDALENEGYAFSVTNTHGNFMALTSFLDLKTVEELENEVPMVFVTTSCLSGNFADQATGNGDNSPQVSQDSVAEELVKNPNGGAVAYIGNTLIGLGPVGGVQFNHSIARALFVEGMTLLGDAMMNARETVWNEVAYVTLGGIDIEFPMTWNLFPGTEWYTQRSVLLLGDPTLRVWTQAPGQLAIDAQTTAEAGYNVIEATATLDESPATAATVTLFVSGGIMIMQKPDANGTVTFQVMLEAGDDVKITVYQTNQAPAVAALEIVE
jgi:hypothetical protein